MIEVLVAGAGATPDLAAYEALKNAVRQETRVLVETKNWVVDGQLLESVVFTKTNALVTRYQIREVQKQNGHYVVRVLAQINELGLARELSIGQGGIVDGPLLASRLEAARNYVPTPDPMRAAQEFWKRYAVDVAYRKARCFLRIVRVEPNGEVVARVEVPPGTNDYHGPEAAVLSNPVESGDPELPYGIRYLDAQGAEVAREEGKVVSAILAKDQWKINHRCRLDPEEVARVRRVEAYWR